MMLAIKLKFQSNNWILKNKVHIFLWPNNMQFNNGCCWPIWKQLCWHRLQAGCFNSVLWKLGWKTLAVPSADPMAAHRHRLLHISAAKFLHILQSSMHFSNVWIFFCNLPETVFIICIMLLPLYCCDTMHYNIGNFSVVLRHHPS